MSAPEAVIAVAGSATAILNLVAAWKTTSQKEKTQAAVLESSRAVNKTLESLEGSVSSLATTVDSRFGDAQAQTTQLLDMYRDLVIRVLPGEARP